MTEDKKADVESEKWAVVTLHPWLPPRAEQVARARSWGVPTKSVGGSSLAAVIEDDVRKVRTTNWPSRLPNRGDFFERMKTLRPIGAGVFFATPLCVGFSEKHARLTVESVFAAGMAVYVHTVKDNGSALYVEGDDMEEFFASVAHLANAAHQRVHQAERRKKEREGK